MALSPGLIDAYRRTEYRVDDRGYHFVLRADAPSDALRSCHQAFGARCSAFVTAWNPGSVPTPERENLLALQRLEQALASRNLTWLRGVGLDPAGSWPGEPSLLVLDLDADAAVAIARGFGQNAILWAGDDAIPRLILLDATP